MSNEPKILELKAKAFDISNYQAQLQAEHTKSEEQRIAIVKEIQTLINQEKQKNEQLTEGK